ncbi:Zinc carboxypeptidase [Nakamurella panacisegetis]|uniref:Zinc carboxypeptidase n=1 Tax=Nakamurella panacisegetis TaxID=1090615 RepID=A0A1H0JS08_9ACTN|nr:M14 family zinc carboxypeptidase [Nakamurella panacisegetis]SDO46477.1 Zinc carboxypeptidase [Nakamurella panacisegetis]
MSINRTTVRSLALAGAIAGSVLLGGTTATAAPAGRTAPVSTVMPSEVTTSAMAASTVTGVRQSRIIGYSRQHRAIVADELGNPAAPFKALVVGSMHGYYERAGEQVVAAIKQAAIPKNLDLWVIRTINPDGDVLHQRGNAAGVDLNRNFPFRWAYIAPTASKFNSHYSGPSPLSEPESRAMYNFLNTLRPNRVVSLHQPLDAVDTTDGGARDIAFRTALARNLGLPAEPLVCWSVCHGSMTGWLTNTQRGAAITVEFGPNPSSAYLTGTAARGIIAALDVGVGPYVPPSVRGDVNTFRASSSGLLLSGWAYDPARPAASTTVAVTIDGKLARVTTAELNRPDVDAAFRITGRHGYWINLVLSRGRHTVCVTARPVSGSDSTPRSLLRCVAITAPQVLMQGRAAPAVVARSGGVVSLSGWALDPSHPLSPSSVRVAVDGKPTAAFVTTTIRADVNAAWHATGRHGFQVRVTVPAGHHLVTVTAAGPSAAVASATIGQQWLVIPAG